MNLDQYVAELQQQLATAAAAGGDDARELAARLTAPLDAAARLALLGALSDAAGEISAELAPGSVDVRLRAGSPEFVVTAPRSTPTGTPPPPAPAATAQAAEPADAEGGATTRTTLRLPDHLKAQAEVAAARDGVSVNTWLVRAVAAALEQSTGRPAARPTQHGSGRVTGWVR
ncbi:HicB-like protein involved in pilus formation [Isoptericola jiangsuensis]|uniref:HicB-like protein involved in pilus formation n=1 Tax=Isoptericola jiangsuensis TaxID=548579 RepID=A0A2A9EVP0_9MICO|nr:toxin-antitoxin system HicB family antitoxin [Isoptericola jiangsuensis]PFG42340.1 HicB-like protein involved in pilus formation [Isoptericola jiangsuensis]